MRNSRSSHAERLASRPASEGAALRNIQQRERRRLAEIEEEMGSIRRELRQWRSQKPDYFLAPRPSTAAVCVGGRVSNIGKRPAMERPRPKSGLDQPEIAITIPSGRPTTAPDASNVSLGLGPTSRQNSLGTGLQEQSSNKSINTATLWKSGMGNSAGSKVDVAKMLVKSHGDAKRRLKKKERQFRPEVSLIELERIKAMNMWLSLHNMPKPQAGNAKQGLPSFALRFIKNQNKDWKFDLESFLAREFPPPVPAREDLMEKTKKQFNNMTAAKALLLFKKRLETYRAKTDEERAAERMWEDLKKVRYLRIPGIPLDPDPSMADIFAKR